MSRPRNLEPGNAIEGLVSDLMNLHVGVGGDAGGTGGDVGGT